MNMSGNVISSINGTVRCAGGTLYDGLNLVKWIGGNIEISNMTAQSFIYFNLLTNVAGSVVSSGK
jgi:hypothetical protein